MAGIDSAITASAHTAAPRDVIPAPPGALIQDRLAGWVSDLTTLHELVERLSRTGSPGAALDELLRAGAALVGAPRGLVVLEPADGLGPVTTVGFGLSPADLGHLETVPRHATAYGRLLLDGAGSPSGAGGGRARGAVGAVGRGGARRPRGRPPPAPGGGGPAPLAAPPPEP
ncbi:hypothetical protein ACFXP3_25400 [Streptomyces sp. NPDC059096]|uniref:hypothetical protein n=1 Tax=Streptomyces sp. NPDC059096 TaxID=3346727 RepID=UPI0036C9EB65